MNAKRLQYFILFIENTLLTHTHIHTHITILTQTITYPHTHADEEDFPPQSQLPYIKKRVTSTSETWYKVQQMLKDRGHQLEIHTGSLQTFLESLQNLIEWIEGKLNLDLLAAPPPGSIELLQQDIQELQVSHVQSTFSLAVFSMLFWFLKFVTDLNLGF